MSANNQPIGDTRGVIDNPVIKRGGLPHIKLPAKVFKIVSLVLDILILLLAITALVGGVYHTDIVVDVASGLTTLVITIKLSISSDELSHDVEINQNKEELC